MNGLRLVLRALHRGERRLTGRLLTAAERHRAEHEVHHVAADLARWSHQHAVLLAATGRHYGLELRTPPGPAASRTGPLPAVRARAAEALAHRPEPGLLLLHDLRALHLAASGNSLYWEMLTQAGHAARDERLLELAAACHPQTLRQIRWADTLLRNLAPQALTGT
ncbi:hypothetical protein GCM10027168_16180 [Streptomyces capparidis]